MLRSLHVASDLVPAIGVRAVILLVPLRLHDDLLPAIGVRAVRLLVLLRLHDEVECRFPS